MLQTVKIGANAWLGLKNKLCKCNIHINFDHTKNAVKQGNAEERPDADCGDNTVKSGSRNVAAF